MRHPCPKPTGNKVSAKLCDSRYVWIVAMSSQEPFTMLSTDQRLRTSDSVAALRSAAASAAAAAVSVTCCCVFSNICHSFRCDAGRLSLRFMDSMSEYNEGRCVT